MSKAGRREILVGVNEEDAERVLLALYKLFQDCDNAVAGLLAVTEENEPKVRAKRGRIESKEVG